LLFLGVQIGLADINSSPGEALPDVPAQTHSNCPGRDGLKPETTPRSILSRIPADAPNEVTGKQKRKGVVYKDWNDLKITKCITCNGGTNRSHPTENRLLTYRECTALQGFPNSFAFYPNDILRQIGNAVPPSIANIIFTAIRKHLEKEDENGGDFLHLRN
jgi:DNA (cytosine-5)-methyltransferase 1